MDKIVLIFLMMLSFVVHAQEIKDKSEIVGKQQPAISKCLTSEFGAKVQDEAS